MPNTGRPSQDCHLCRARRVKCDLARPSCLRCTNYGAPCPGYRDEADMVFRNEDVSTVGRRTQRRSRKTGVSPSSQSGQSHSRSSSTSTCSSSSTPGTQATRSVITSHPVETDTVRRRSASPVDLAVIFSQLAKHLQTGTLSDPDHYRAVTRSLGKLLTIMTRTGSSSQTLGFRGWLEFLPGLFLETPSSSCLFLVSDLFSSGLSSPSSPTHLYTLALRSVHSALSDPSLAPLDSTLASVWLLSHYEILVSSRQTSRIPAPDAWHAHTQGLTGLLRIRGAAQFTTERGRAMFRVMLSIIQVRCMIANVEFPPETAGWLSEILAQESGEEETPVVHHSFHYAMCAASLIARLSHLLTTGTPDQVCLSFPTLLSDLSSLERSPTATALLAIPSTPAQTEINNLYFLVQFRATRLKLHYQFAALATVVADLTRRFPALVLLGLVEDQDEFRAGLVRQRRESSVVARDMAEGVLDAAMYVLGMMDSTTTTTTTTTATTTDVRERVDLEDAMQAASLHPCSPTSPQNTSPHKERQGKWTHAPIWADGASLLWPCTLVMRLPISLPAQQRAARECLGTIAKELGIRQARRSYERATRWQYEVGGA